jgi:hypothetical protein
MLLNEIFSVQILFREALILGSINFNRGIVGVNQSAGNINNQLNAATMAVSLDTGVALGEADLGQFNTGCFFFAPQTVTEWETSKAAGMFGSVNWNRGVVGVNQTVGNMANQANIANVAVSTR